MSSETLIQCALIPAERLSADDQPPILHWLPASLAIEGAELSCSAWPGKWKVVQRFATMTIRIIDAQQKISGQPSNNEPFVLGLPPEALRAVCPTWEVQTDGPAEKFSLDKKTCSFPELHLYSMGWWEPRLQALPRTVDSYLMWHSVGFRPAGGRTRYDVEAEAAEFLARDDAKCGRVSVLMGWLERHANRYSEVRRLAIRAQITDSPPATS